MDYTMIGGAVNLASRLEGAADPGAILISDKTEALIRSEVLCKEHGQIQVRGIARPVQTFEIIALAENVSDAMQPLQHAGEVRGRSTPGSSYMQRPEPHLSGPRSKKQIN
jgi:hypothetical protein